MWYASWKTPILALPAEDSLLGRDDPPSGRAGRGSDVLGPASGFSRLDFWLSISRPLDALVETVCLLVVCKKDESSKRENVQYEGLGSWTAPPEGHETTFCSDWIMTLESMVIFDSYNLIPTFSLGSSMGVILLAVFPPVLPRLRLSKC